MAKNPKPDKQTTEDIEYLSTVLAKGISGLIEIGITDGLKLGQALKRVTTNKANDQLVAQLWSRFFLVNPRAAEAIEALSLINPKIAALLERLRMKAKDATPDRDEGDVKDAEPC